MIPIYLINRNRLSYAIKLTDWLLQIKNVKPIIIDNASTYQPLLEWYKNCPVEVIRLDYNGGANVAWISHICYTHFKSDYYGVSDIDIIPDVDCPLDAIDRMVECLNSLPFIEKVGFSLKIDDLPDNELTRGVIDWERKYWKKNTPPWGYNAAIDTTFAIHRIGQILHKNSSGRSNGGHSNQAIRLYPPYTAKHLPWYVESGLLTEEDKFYIANATGESTWSRTLIDYDKRGIFKI